MAIKIKKQEDKINVEIDNGHAKALSKIVKDYNLVDEEAALGFMLSVFVEGSGKPVTANGVAFIPSDRILKDKNLDDAGQDK